MLTKEIKTIRKTGVGGSDAAAVCGLSRFKSPLDVYLEKKSDVQDEENEEANGPIYWGNRLEAVIRADYQLRTGKKVAISNETRRHKKYSHMLANVDAIIEGENGILECKTTNAFKSNEWGNEGTDEIPIEYLLQAAHYACVYEADFVDVAVLIGGQELKIYKYIRNQSLEDKVIEKEKEFWEKNIEKEIQPAPKSFEDMKKLYALSTKDKCINASDEMIKNIDDILKVKEIIKTNTSIKNELQEKILKEMKDAEVILTDDGKKICSYKTQSTNRFDATAFKNDNPDLYKKYIKSSTSRVLRT